MGVTYYKLEQRYEGDKTKGCGLTTVEMDENFHFLRGYDVKSADFTDGILTLERVNSDKIVVSGIPEYVMSIVDSAVTPLDFSATYNPENGVLTITVNGVPYLVGGFDETDSEFKLYVSYGIDGDGTSASPIRISHVNDTGFYASVEKVLENEDELPSMGEVGDRFVTREVKSPYGLLYTANEVRAIDEWLQENGNGWRVPTIDEWNEMLNALECYDEDRTHGATGETSNNGAIAATKLKSEEFHDEAEANEFNAYPTQKIGNIAITSFWTRTVSEENALYAKELQQNNDKVLNRRSGQGNLDLRAIRLIKSADYNRYENEEIGGEVYKTLTLPAYKNGSVYTTNTWLAENLMLSGINGVEGLKPYGSSFYLNTLEEYERSSTYSYYINAWDSFGKKWDKKELRENDIFIVDDFDGSGNPKEVIVKIDENGNQMLVPHFQEIYDRINEVIAETESAITIERADREAAIENLENIIIQALSGITGDTSSILSRLSAAETAISGLSEDKVDKVPGKGLSTNDYTNEEKEKVATSGKIDVPVDEYSANTPITTVLLDIYSKINGATIDSDVMSGSTVLIPSGTSVTEGMQIVVNTIASGGTGFITEDIKDAENNVVISSGATTTQAAKALLEFTENSNEEILSTLSEQIAELSGSTSEDKAVIDEAIETVSGRVDTIETEMASADARITEIESLSADTRITELEGSAVSAATQIAEIRGIVENIEGADADIQVIYTTSGVTINVAGISNETVELD